MLDRSCVVHRQAWLAGAAAVALVVAVAVAVAAFSRPRASAPACDDVPSLGVCVAPSPDGARIVQIAAGSPGARAGWRGNDLIEEVMCREVRDAAQLEYALAHYAPRIKIVRNGEAISYRMLPR